MNYKMVLYVLGQLMKVEAAILALPLIVSVIYEENTGPAFLAVIALLLVMSIAMTAKKPKNRRFGAREGFVVVAFCWILYSMIGALPFTISGEIPNYIDAVFEMTSGFTTTGASILTDVEAMSHGMMFWRCFSHWIGGMGILVFVLSLAPLVGASAVHMFRAESPGLTVDKLVPKMRSSAFILYAIYTGMTLIEFVLLLLGGMNVFDALLHSFSTAGTGGFSNYAASVGHFDSVYIDTVITIFMLMFGVGFQTYFFIVIGRIRRAFANEELRWYLLIVAAAILAVTLNIRPLYDSFGSALRYGAFQVASIISTTGFATADFALWPTLAGLVLCALMVVGACSGSTGGGIKVSRLVVTVKALRREMKHLARPRHIAVIKLDGKTVAESTVHNALVFLAAWVLILILSVLIVSVDGFDVSTSITSVLACIGNVGPGLGAVGPTGSFAGFSALSKIVLTLDMLIGRLEIFPVLILLSRNTWKKN